MIGTIAKTFAYAKAPKKTFTILHPRRAAKLRRLKHDVRHAYAPRLIGAGVVAMAIPLGFALGRRARGTNEDE